MTNLEIPGTLTALAQRMKNDIDDWCVREYDDGPRSHLGASLIGHPCSKHLWFSFRWIAHKTHDGRQYRLFQRGHLEENRFLQYLEGIGCTVQLFAKTLWWHPESDTYLIDDIDMQEKRFDADTQVCVNVLDKPDHVKKAEAQGVVFDKGKAQIRISGCKGHFGGSTDGLLRLPEHYNIPDEVVFLAEMKTQGVGKKGKNFDELVAKGMREKKAQHWAQMCVYGFKLGIKYGVYLSVNKNDDELHIEVLKLDHTLGEAMLRKAEMIIFSQTPPNGISASPAFFECTYCDHREQCFFDGKVDVNCRSCKHAKAVDDAEWLCEWYNSIIPKEHIPNACNMWVSILGGKE